MTAAKLSEEQREDLWAAVRKLRHDGRGTLAGVLELMLVGDTITSGERVRVQVYSDYCDRSGFRDRSRALEALLRE